MRVTAGKFRGRVLVENKFEHIRPTADVVKQAIFNKLGDRVLGSKVLDLFCGTGALGIEAISRGASEVVFADKDNRSVGLTRANFKNLGIDARLIRANYEKTLDLLKGEQFDIILLDPPYKSGVYEDCIQRIANNNLLASGGIIVCEHDKKDDFDFSPFEVVSEKRYGIKMVTYLNNRD